MSDVEGKLKSENNLSEKLSNELNQMKLENKNVAEELVDIKTKSMRDNLIFFDFDEQSTFNSRKSEDCCAKIKMFCEKDLGILDASSSIKIDKAHRTGKFTPGSKRPIVAKLNFYQDKLLIKQMVHEKRGNITHRVADQSKEVQDRRRILIPYMVAVRSQGKQASLVADKLYINNTLYTANKLAPGPPPEIPPRRPYSRDGRSTTEPSSSRRPPAGRPPLTVASHAAHQAANDTTDRRRRMTSPAVQRKHPIIPPTSRTPLTSRITLGSN